MMSTTNEMDIEFVSDYSMSKKGFEAEYRTGLSRDVGFNFTAVTSYVRVLNFRAPRICDRNNHLSNITGYRPV